MGQEQVARIAVAAAGGQAVSATWRIWSNNDEIYVAIRSLAGVFKSSLHSSGLFRHAFVKEDVSEKHQGPGRDRAVSKWEWPQPQVPMGTLLFQVVIPGAGLASFSTEPPSSDTQTVSAFGEDEVGYISVSELAAAAIGRPIRFGSTEARELASWQLPRGTRLSITWHLWPLTPSQCEMLSQRTTTVREAELRRRDGHQGRGCLRSFFAIVNPDGVGRLMDVGPDALGQWLAKRKEAGAQAT
jgi:hypothetical protein